MNRKTLSLVLVISFMLSLTACTNKSDDNDGLTMYAEENSLMYELIAKYNKYCDLNYDDSYKINIILLDDSNKDMTKISTELMTGGGPDIISTDLDLPISKLIQQDVFADINQLIDEDAEDKLNFNELNSIVMDSGIFNGKRYMLPISFYPNILITTKELCDKYGISVNEKFTYNNFAKSIENFLNEAHKNKDLGVQYGLKYLFFNFINDYVDFSQIKTSLESNSFNNSLNEMNKLITTRTSYDNNLTFLDGIIGEKYLFSNGDDPGYSIVSMALTYYKIFGNNKTPVIFNGVNKDENTVSAFVADGVLLNKNSNKKDKAYCFFKYVLSERVQENLNQSAYLPVNTKAFNNIVDNCKESSYDISGLGLDFVGNGIDNDFITSYIKIINSINECKIDNDYYNENIINDIVEDYLNEEITEDKFIGQIKSKTEIYINE